MPGAGAQLSVINPANGDHVGTVNAASIPQVLEAISLGAEAVRSSGWLDWEPHRRALVLHAIAQRIEDDAPRLAELQMVENGKTRRESLVQARSAAATFRYYAGLCEVIQDAMPPARGDYFTMTAHEPFGVIAAITPWNSPLTMAAQKLAPALAAGNAVVLKPAETTSLVSLALGECCAAPELPEGLVSVLPGGAEIGAALTEAEGIGCISFTGGTATGQHIAASAGRRLVPVILELGGKSPQIVFQDADLPAAAKAICEGIFAAAGQSCVAGSRLFCHASIAEELSALLIARVEKLVVGPPAETATDIGPLSSFAHRDRVEAMVAAAVEAGASVVAGARRPSGAKFESGAYYLPTILGGVANTSRIAQEEVFGPVLCAMQFTDEDDLLSQANDSAYGLASGIWTADYRRAWRVARRLQAGTVWINTYKQLSIAAPFGGFKNSGLGREKGIEGLRAYQQTKSVFWGL